MTPDSPLLGLSAEVAAARLAAEGFNELPLGKQRHLGVIVLEVLQEPMFALLLLGGLVYLLLGDRLEALLLLLFAGFSVGITLVQASRSEHVLEALRHLASPRARVIRDGALLLIEGRALVRGDVLVLAEGDRVAGDGEVIQAHELMLDESLLTGESLPVAKSLSAPNACVFAGSLVTRGSGLVRVTALGARSQMGLIGQSLNAISSEPALVQRQIRGFVRVFALIGGLATLLVILLYGLLRGSWLEALLSGIAIGMSLLPEEFPLVLAVFMAMGAWRISVARVLTRKASAIETLGATSVLCTDKTGTLTENRMAVCRLYTLPDAASVQAEDWADGAQQAPSPPQLKLLAVACLAAGIRNSEPMDKAIWLCGQAHLAAEYTHLQAQVPALSLGLQAGFLAVCHFFPLPDDTSFRVCAKGAVESLLPLCTLTDAARQAVYQAADALAAQGIRVLAVAETTSANTCAPPQSLAFTFLGLVGFKDPLRANVPAAIAECQGAGVRIIMITGDNGTTAQAIAQQAGLGVQRVISGAQLDAMSDDQLKQALAENPVFARILPAQKLRIVECLKAQGEIVAMTGDGVNDAPAIKAAHIGIAMGKRGTDVAREAAALVLLDDDFGSIVTTVRLGRRIWDNLRKAIEYIVAVHIPIAGMAFLPVVLGIPLILSPIHIAFLEMLIDPACSLVFEAETAEDDAMRQPPRNPKHPLINTRHLIWGALQGLVVFGLLVGLLLWGRARALPEDDLRVLVFTALVMQNAALILLNRSANASLKNALLRPNRALWILLSLVTGLMTLAILWPFAAELFHFGQLPLMHLGVCVGLSGVMLLVLERIKRRWFLAVKVL
ncbi:MAG: hypothetical protein RL497_2257 [Pseudomonadota bacterium]|jgi:Ca2+-transporting ATPase